MTVSLRLLYSIESSSNRAINPAGWDFASDEAGKSWHSRSGAVRPEPSISSSLIIILNFRVKTSNLNFQTIRDMLGSARIKQPGSN